MRSNEFFRCVIGLLVASCVCLGASPLRAQTTNSAKVTQLLKETGFAYTTHNANTWSVDFDRKNLGKVKVIISTGTDIVVTFAILAKKATIQKTPKFLETIAVANHEYDYTKTGLDKDGDLFVRIDTLLRVTDGMEMKSVIEQVANASEEVFVKVSGSIKR